MKLGIDKMVSFFVVFVLLLAPTTAFAERKPWDQARVTEIAGNLDSVVAQVVGLLDQQTKSDESGSVLENKIKISMLADLRRIHSLTTRLLTKLKAGEGFNETRTTYDEIQLVRLHAREDGRRVFDFDSPISEVVAARGFLDKLSGYYEIR